MQVLINISKEVYGRLCILTDHGIGSDLENYILNGTVIPSPCDVCRYRPPSSTDGKPCCMCPAEKGASNDADSN